MKTKGKKNESSHTSQRSAVRHELLSLCDRAGGTITPESVVAFARRNAASALHGQFEWDDSEAAEQYRMQQARSLLTVFVEVIAADTKPVRLFCSLPSDRLAGNGYRLTAQVLSNAAQREELLACALAELSRFEKRYASIKKLAAVFAAIRKIKGAK